MQLLSHPHVVAFDDLCDDALDHLRGNRVSDRVFYGLTEAANHSLLWHVCTWLPVLAGRRTVKDAIVISSLIGVESALVNGVIKRLFRRERPTVEDVRPHQLRQPKTSSFPSGHATSAFCAALLLGSQRTLPAWCALAGAVATSRAYVRIHHASDVVGGTVMGLGLGLVARRVAARLR